MKILAVSDEVIQTLYSPNLREKYPEVDLVIGCGDLPVYYLDFITTTLNAPLCYVPGNHDEAQVFPEAVDSGCCGDNLDRVVHSLAAGEQRLLLAGLGGSVRYRPQGTNQHTQLEMYRRVRQMFPALWFNRVRYGRYVDILVTHAPPRGIHDRATPAHTGFNALLWFMDLFKPRYLLHGHTHLYRRDVPTHTRYKQTEVINVFPYYLLDFSFAPSAR